MLVKQKNEMRAIPLTYTLHTASDAQGGGQCCEHCYHNLNHRLPKFLVLHGKK
jgi:hypothetical protein